MTEYQKLKRAERIAHTIEVIEPESGKKGVANTCPGGIFVFYGADDGSDDAILTPREFNRRFKITAAIMG
jgi:hypothetical protein